jgi:hypothetical protein
MRCEQILRNCRRAILETCRLLVVDMVLSDEKNVPAHRWWNTSRTCSSWHDARRMLRIFGDLERLERS